MKVKRYPPSWTVHEGDCIDRLSRMPDGSAHCCVTSPPYWGLRDYGVAGQHGSEPTLKAWLRRQLEVFDEVRRVLRDDGTLWLNLGDTFVDGKMQGQPWRLALGLVRQGWRLRMDVVWHKPNAYPEALLRKRPKLAHEYVFMLTKSKRYYYDAEGEGRARPSVWKIPVGGASTAGHFAAFPDELPRTCVQYGTSDGGACEVCGAQFERRMELTELGQRLKGKSWSDHEDSRRKGQGGFTNPICSASELRRFAGWRRPCEHRGFGVVAPTVIDPYGGSGTTGRVALELGRSAVLVELNPEWAALARASCAEGEARSGRVTAQGLQASAAAGRMGGLEEMLFLQPAKR